MSVQRVEDCLVFQPAACEMVAVGVPLGEIAQVQRHHSLRSTAVYARVDVEQLRLLATPWPGGTPR